MDKYKEALQKAKQALEETESAVTAGILKEIFQELREMDDEKIRKEITDMIYYYHGKLSCFPNPSISLEDTLAWLEKQKDQSRTITALEAWKEMRNEVFAQASGNRHEPNVSDEHSKIFSLSDINEIFEKVSDSVVEQKSAEKVDIIAELKHHLETTPKEQLKKEWDDLKKWCNVEPVVEEFLQGKSVKWSDEYEKMFESALWHVKNSCGNGGKDSGEFEVYNWLKFLKDRLQHQPKQEWSKEDEIKIENLLKWLILSLGYNNDEHIQSKVKEMIDWLESLKYKVQPQPNHWKPSEEQIYALAYSLGKGGVYSKQALEKLLDELKTLHDYE